MDPREIKADEALERLLTPLAPDELARLAESIKAEGGCREPLVIWAQTGILLDGHARRRILIELDLEAEVRLVELPNREAAVRWRLAAQLERRNLSPMQVSWVRGRLYLSTRKKPGRPRNSGNSGQNVPKSTDDELAARCGVDARTIRRDARFARAVHVIEERLGFEFRDRILAREVPMTRGQVINWARDLWNRKVDEADIRRRIEDIKEERRRKKEQASSPEKRLGAAVPAAPVSKDEVAGGPCGPDTEDAVPTTIPLDSPLSRLYRAWDDASDYQRREFLAMPEVYDLAAEVVGCRTPGTRKRPSRKEAARA